MQDGSRALGVAKSFPSALARCLLLRLLRMRLQLLAGKPLGVPQLLTLVLAAGIVDRHLAASRAQLQRDGTANATGSASHDAHAALHCREGPGEAGRAAMTLAGPSDSGQAGWLKILIFRSRDDTMKMAAAAAYNRTGEHVVKTDAFSIWRRPWDCQQRGHCRLYAEDMHYALFSHRK